MQRIRNYSLSLIALVVIIAGASFIQPTPPQTHSQTKTVTPIPIVVPEEQATIASVNKTRPAVVSIVISKNVLVNQPMTFVIPNDFLNDPFFQITPHLVPSGPPKEETRQIGSGTGFIVNSNGLIVTNKHVASDSKATYTVFLNDGRSFPATIVSVDPLNDIALLKIKVDNLPTVSLGNSDTIEVGQTVLAIGNSLGRYQNTVTKGVISGIGRSVVASDNRGQPEELSDIIQTDAAINPGNSGGPLLNLRGEVIAVNTAVDLQGQSIGFAIPINTVKYVVDSVQKTGKIIRPWIGVRFVVITPDIQKSLNLPVKNGLLIARGQNTDEMAVIEGSPAFTAGIREGDIIAEVDSVKLNAAQTLPKIIAKHKVGDSLNLKVIRNGKTLNVTVELRAAPSQ